MKSSQPRKHRRLEILAAVLALPALCGLGLLLATAGPALVDEHDLSTIVIYAYRDWQSTGVMLQPGQTYRVQARGTWMYTPGEWNGADGHPRYPAPSFYPVPGVRGGALIGRVGENGQKFFVGSYHVRAADVGGMLFLRIDDDILSDNEGQLQVDVSAVK